MTRVAAIQMTSCANVAQNLAVAGDLLRQAKAFTATLPKEQLGSRMLLLDNWNEWGEGHYIAPSKVSFAFKMAHPLFRGFHQHDSQVKYASHSKAVIILL